MNVLASRVSLVVLLSFAPLALPAQDAGPGAAPLTVEQALALRSVTNPQLGNDFVAFNLVVPRPIADGPGSAYLHLGVIGGLSKLSAEGVAAQKPEVRWLVAGKETAPSMAVRPGTREASFVRAVDGAAQILVMSIDGGDPRVFAKMPAVTAYRWRPDGKAISFTSLDAIPEQRAAAGKRGFQPVIVDEDFRHLSLWFVEEGGEPKRLTTGVTVFDHQWAFDGSKIACAVAPKNLVDDSYMFTRLKSLDVATGKLDTLVDNPGKLGSFAWSAHDEMFAYVTATDRNDPHAGQLRVLMLETGRIVTWPTWFSGMTGDVQWPTTGLVRLHHDGVRTALHGRVEDDPVRENGEQARTFSIPNGQITAFSATHRYRAVAASTASRPAELFLEGKGQLTDSNPGLANVALGEQTIEKVRARDGLEFEGILIKPVGYREGTKYPFVIVVHGGPEAHFSDGWLTSYGNWGQLLAARGYVSWYPNYRSSTGYGTAFCKHDHGDPMGKEFTDHLDAIEHFSKAGLIDKDRVGIGGGSYGGYTAAWGATKHSEHFAAAVSFVPFVDLRTKWLTSDIPFEFFYVHYQEQWPWQQPGLMADRSPLSWVTSCKTPLLVLGGTADPRVHPSQPFMLYRAVKFATATPTRYVQYPGEGHGNRTNVYQLDYALRTLQWFDHYLKGDGDRRKKPLPPMDVDYGG